jgi:hypothetical protein
MAYSVGDGEVLLDMVLNVPALRRLSDNELDTMTSLGVLADAQRGGILDDVREKVILTNQANGWNDQSLRETVIATTASYLVPARRYDWMSEFTLITAAWQHVDISEAKSVTWDELFAVTSQALQCAYAQAVRNLVDWAEKA